MMQLLFSVDDRDRLAHNLRELTSARAGGTPYAPVFITLVMDNGDEHDATRAKVVSEPVAAVVWETPEAGENGVIALDMLKEVKATFVGGYSLKDKSR